MSDSLCRGETTYHLSDAKALRLKLLKLAEGVDLMSKKISALGTDTQNESFVKSRRYLLQTQIRRASVNFIKETLVGLPSLPSEEELVVIQERRKEEIAKRVEEERRRTQEARIKFRNMQVFYCRNFTEVLKFPSFKSLSILCSKVPCHGRILRSKKSGRGQCCFP